MDLRDLVRLARRQWWAVVGLAVVGGLLAAVVSAVTTPTYRSTAQVYIAVGGTTTADAYTADLYGSARIQSYAELAASAPVLARAITDLRLDTTAERLASQVSATVVGGTAILAVSATSDSAGGASRLAQAEAEALGDYVNSLERSSRRSAAKGSTRAERRAAAKGPVQASVVDPAEVPGGPETPRTGLNIAVSTLLGMLVGLGVAVAREVLDSRARTGQDVHEALGAPVLATIPDPARSVRGVRTGGDPQENVLEPTAARLEAFRVLRTSLRFLDPDHRPRCFAITGTSQGVGSSWTAVSLALSLAQSDERVLLVDGNLRAPVLDELLQVDGTLGLTSVIVGLSDLPDAVQVHEPSGVHVLPAGPLPPNPAELWGTGAARDVLAKARAEYDVVVVDTPALLPVADAAVVATLVDGVIVVTRHAAAGRETLAEVRERLDTVGARLFGAVVTSAPASLVQTGAYAGGRASTARRG